MANIQFPANNSGHRKRLRDRFLHGGGRALQKYEKLELLLTYCIPRRDVKPLAKTLLNHFGSIQNLMNASLDDLTEIPGISENSSGLIMLIRELCSIYLEEELLSLPCIEDTVQVVNFARMKIGGASKESFMLIFLNSSQKILHYECCPEGTVNHTHVYMRELISMCIKYNAISLIIVHNHPSGLCIPSHDDLRFNIEVKKALTTVDIKFLDHIIVSGANFHSMAAHKEL